MKRILILLALFISSFSFSQSTQFVFGPQDKSLGIDATLPLYKGIGFMAGFQKGCYQIDNNYKVPNHRYKFGISSQLFSKPINPKYDYKTLLIFHIAYCINKYKKNEKDHFKKNSIDIGIRTNILETPFTVGFNYDLISRVGAFTFGIHLKRRE